MRKKTPRYDLAVQRHAAEQVIVHHRPIAQVARQLRCSPQSVKNWIDKHHQSPPTPVSSLPSRQSLSAFLPIHVESPSVVPTSKIELVMKNGLILRFPLETPAEVLCGTIRQLESVLC
jgi:transposase-like protein